MKRLKKSGLIFDVRPVMNQVMLVLLFLHSPQVFSMDETKFQQSCYDFKNQDAKIGEQTRGECTKAAMAKDARKVLNAQGVIFTTAAAATAALIAFEWAGSGMACAGISLGVSVASGIMDQNQVLKSGEYTTGFSNAIKTGVGMAKGVGVGAVTSAIFKEGGLKELASKTKGVLEKKGGKASCIVSTALNSLQATRKFGDAKKARDYFENSSSAAFNYRSLSGSGAQFSGARSSSGGGSSDHQIKAPPRLITPGDECMNKKGSEANRCLAALTPEMSAIMADHDFVQGLESALGGKSLGEFALGFNGNESDVAKYVANGLGMTPTGEGMIQSLLQEGKKLADKIGLPQEGSESESTFTYSSPGSKESDSSSSAETDLEKMMKEMMAGLNDESADGSKSEQASDEQAERQMEILSPDQVAEKSDLSLFKRVTIRYKKQYEPMASEQRAPASQNTP